MADPYATSLDNGPARFLGSLRWCLLSISAAMLASCKRAGVLDPQGPISAAEKLILLNATAIMLVVVAPVIVLTVVFAWWYRASNSRATYRPDWNYSGRVELVTWAIPAMVVILLAGVAWIGSHDLDPGVKLDAKVPPVRIQVVSLDWKWLFIYPDNGLASVNEVFIPADTPIEFALTSATVMNAFFVPQLGSQIYTMPGMTTHLSLAAERAGDYPGLSSHFSGEGFSDMRFVVHAMSRADFDRWLTQAHAAKDTLADGTYGALLKPSHNDEPHIYGTVEPMLYEHIMQRAAPAAPSASRGH